MPIPTYTLIASTTVGSGGASSIDFTSIPATYTDLVLKVSGRGSVVAINGVVLLEINGLTSGYTARSLYGNGASAASDTNPYSATNKLFAGENTGASSTASVFGSAEIYIPNYAGNTAKSVSSDSVSENNATTAYTVLAASLSSNTSAITSIKIYPYTSTTWVQYSTAYLYGIKSS